MSLDRAASLRALRARLSTFDPTLKSGRVLRFGDRRIDGCFPASGLPLGCWHEIEGQGAEADDAALAAGFAARLAGACGTVGEVVWVLRRDDLYAPGLAELGLDPARLLIVRTRSEAETLAAVEDALATRGVSAVLGEVERVELTAGRRLQLACERRGATALMLRRRLHGTAPRTAARPEPAVAASRWRVSCAPSAPEGGEPGLGAPRWRTELLRARGGRTGAWIVEGPETGSGGEWRGDGRKDRSADGAIPFRVVAELADHQLAAADPGDGFEPAPRRRAVG